MPRNYLASKTRKRAQPMANTQGLSSTQVDLIAMVYDGNERQVTSKNGKERTVYNVDVKLNTLPGANEGRAPQTDNSLSVRYAPNGKVFRSLAYEQTFMDNIKNFPSQPLHSKDGEVIGKMVSLKGDLAPVTNKDGKPVGLRVKQDSVKPGLPIPENTKDLMYQIGRAEQSQIKAEKTAGKVAAPPEPAKDAQEAQMGG